MKNISSLLLAGLGMLFLNEQGMADDVCLGAEACRAKVLDDCMNDGEKCGGLTLGTAALDACLETKQCKESNIKDNYDYQNCAKEAGCYPQDPGATGQTPSFPFPPQQPGAPGGAPGVAPGGTPGITPGGVPGATPGGTPGAPVGPSGKAPGKAPGAKPSGTLEEESEERIDF